MGRYAWIGWALGALLALVLVGCYATMPWIVAYFLGFGLSSTGIMYGHVFDVARRKARR